MDAERMNTTAHQVTCRIVNQPMPGNRIFPAKSTGNNRYLVVSAIFGTGVSGVAMRFIFDLDRQRLQAGKPLPQVYDGFAVHAGRAFLNGLTVTFS